MNTNTVAVSDSYSPAEAERGKFTRVSVGALDTLGISASSKGRYAIFTYNLNDTMSISNSSVPVQFTTPNAVELPHVNTIPSLSAVEFSFANTSSTLEIYNNSNVNNLYLAYEPTALDTLSAVGMIIEAGSYYSVDISTSYITLGSVASSDTDVRIFNQYIV